MVTEPEPGFVSLVDRLDAAREWIWFDPRRGNKADREAASDHIATIEDAIEALQMEDGSSQGLKPAVSGGREDAPTWRPIETAPRDGTPIVARLAQFDPGSRWEHLSGRRFVIRHEGMTASGFNLGWSIYPGLGGAPDEWIDCWSPLPAPPTEEPTP